MRVRAAVPATACGILFLIAACRDGIRTWAVYQPHSRVPEMACRRWRAGDLPVRCRRPGPAHGDLRQSHHGFQGGFSRSRCRCHAGQQLGPTTRVTARPSESARAGYRVVMVFSGDRYLGAEAACQELDPAALSPVAERVELQAVFCFNKRVLSQAHITNPAFTTTGG